jgi:hypothetical protein
MYRLLIILLLSGCVSPEVARQRQEAEAMQIVEALTARCNAQGYTQAPELGRCILQTMERLEGQANLINALRSQQPIYVAPPPQRRMPQQTNCQYLGYGQTSCQTN